MLSELGTLPKGKLIYQMKEKTETEDIIKTASAELKNDFFGCVIQYLTAGRAADMSSRPLATYSCAGKNSKVARKTRRHGLVSPWLAKRQRAKKGPATGCTAWTCARNANRRLISPNIALQRDSLRESKGSKKRHRGLSSAGCGGSMRKWQCREHSADGAEAKAG